METISSPMSGQSFNLTFLSLTGIPWLFATTLCCPAGFRTMGLVHSWCKWAYIHWLNWRYSNLCHLKPGPMSAKAGSIPARWIWIMSPIAEGQPFLWRNIVAHQHYTRILGQQVESIVFRWNCKKRLCQENIFSLCSGTSSTTITHISTEWGIIKWIT